MLDSSPLPAVYCLFNRLNFVSIHFRKWQRVQHPTTPSLFINTHSLKTKHPQCRYIQTRILAIPFNTSTLLSAVGLRVSESHEPRTRRLRASCWNLVWRIICELSKDLSGLSEGLYAEKHARIPWRMHRCFHNPPYIQMETMGNLLRKHSMHGCMHHFQH